MSGCNFRSDFIAAVCSSQKHRFFCTSKPASTNSSNPDTHCQLIQRGDQSEAPFQHTLRGRVGKQSTVCIICTGYFFLSASVSHLPGTSSQVFQRGGFQNTPTKLEDNTGTDLFELPWSFAQICSSS